ncbi:MAG TPA: glycosyltransferase family 39 protein, partial [Candidatus Krumholzibacteria bacterium]|nr:glycosyltransferase family 39 protein [Candidatus Krumholzibacteria bacterium]
NSFELIFWALGFLIVIDILENGRTATWIALGVCIGLGMENKISLGVFATAVGLAILAANRLRPSRVPGLFIAVAIAVVLFAPHVVWQIAHDWPTREFIANAQRHKMTAMGPLAYLGGVAMEMSPLLVPLYIAGLVALWFHPSLRRSRPLAWAFIMALAIFMLNRSKPYYTVAAFPPLIAACAVWIEWATRRPRLGWLVPTVAVYALASFAITAPFAIPILSVEKFIAYQDAIGIRPSSGENRDAAVLPQFFADRFGWEELTAQVAAVFEALPPDDRAACLIVARNYGQAGAINYYGPRLGLPRAVCQHNSYYLWGYGALDPLVYVIIGQDRDDLESTFTEVREVARTGARYAMPDETNVPIWICRGIRIPLAEAWERGRMFI